MTKYALALLDLHGAPVPALFVGDDYWNLGALGAHFDLCQAWDTQQPAIEAAVETIAVSAAPSEAKIDAELATLLPPVVGTRAIYAVGANYHDHIRDGLKAMVAMGFDTPKRPAERPLFFSMPPAPCLAGPGDTIYPPQGSVNFDTEIELCAVIGKAGRRIPQCAALDHVMGYTIALDMSARDYQLVPGTMVPVDLFAGKVFDGSCPVGPVIVPADQLADVQSIDLGLRVNGEAWQHGSTAGMVMTVAQAIFALSHQVSLHPGDLILTGTPAGTGLEQGKKLNSGDHLQGWIAGIGALSVNVGAR